MGYLTTITIYNDGCDQLQKHPQRVAKVLYEACLGTPGDRDWVGIGNHANLITVQRPRHADSWTLYFHAGNTVTDLSEVSGESPCLDNAISMLKVELTRLKKIQKERDDADRT